MNMATYETFAAVYDAVMDDSLYDLWTDFSLRHLPKSKDRKKLLELACGTGIQSVRFSQAGFDVTGLDLSADIDVYKRQISRYILMNNEGLTLEVARENVAKVAAGQSGNVTDRWILHNLNETIGKVTENFDKFEFGVAGHILYNFIWDEFADWYLSLIHI